ncbi:pentapeptide repeat-containing protein [Nocardiopsis changdeensis]|uniref:pentapeptide repeat-containing protein n=1 Tax=Nocardiopsis changdeensis TaxID=2831969 RepID=UPI003F455F86
MRIPLRYWIAVFIMWVAGTALGYTIWPLFPFLLGLIPPALPLTDILLSVFFTVLLVAGFALNRSRSRGRPLWLGWLILAAWTVAAAMVAAIVIVIWLVLGSPGVEEAGDLSPRDLDAIATRAFAVVAGLGGVALLVIHYRRQLITERGELAKLFHERFSAAYTELGNEHAAVRLGAVHALAHLADDASTEEEAQMVIDVLCAYLRTPYSPAPEPLHDADAEQAAEHRDRELEFASQRQVRHTIIRIIGDRLRRPTRWRDKDYDFTGVVFDGGNLSGAVFTGSLVSFREAQFTGGTMLFRDAEFAGFRVGFDGAVVNGGDLDFTHTKFSGALVTFAGTRFIDGHVDFGGATFTHGKLIMRRAVFSGAEVLFDKTALSNKKIEFDDTHILLRQQNGGEGTADG